MPAIIPIEIDSLDVERIVSVEQVKARHNTVRTPLKITGLGTPLPLCIILPNCITYGVKDDYMSIYVKDESALEALGAIENRINDIVTEQGFPPINPIIKPNKDVFYPKLHTEFKSDKITTAFYDSEGRMIDPITYPCVVKVAVTIKDVYHTAHISYCQIRINEVEVIEPIVRNRLL